MQHGPTTVVGFVDRDELLALSDFEAVLGDLGSYTEWTTCEFLPRCNKNIQCQHCTSIITEQNGTAQHSTAQQRYFHPVWEVW